MVFDDDIAPFPVRPVVTDHQEWAQDIAARLSKYLHTRFGGICDVENSIVEVAGALLAVLPLPDAIAAIASAMTPPSPPVDEYKPRAGDLTDFAAAVNDARRIVYEYCDDCWAARRVVLVHWSRRAHAAELEPDELEAALAECSVVVAEAALSDKRLAVFERGLRSATSAAEDAAAGGASEVLERLVAEVEAAGLRHSMPPAMTVECL